MSDTPRFSCGACQRTYAWKPELAGKKVRCKCGQIMVAPAEAPAVEQEDLYDLAPSGAEPRQSSVPLASAGAGAAASAMAPAPAAARSTPRPAVLAYGSKPVSSFGQRKQEAENSLGGAAWREVYLPSAILLAGIALAVVERMHFSLITFDLRGALVYTGLRLMVDMVLLAAGCLAAIRLIDVGFGSPGPAALKVAAIAIAPGVVGNIISFLIHDPFGIVGGIISLCLYWALFHFLFDLDTSEVWLLAGIVLVVRMWIGTFLVLVLINAVMGGSIGGVSLLPAPQFNTDRAAADEIDMGHTTEAKAWLQNGNHVFLGTTNGTSLDFIKALYAAGCKDCQVVHQGPEADRLYVQLPGGKDLRKQVFDLCVAAPKDLGIPKLKDEGQKYLTFEFFSAR